MKSPYLINGLLLKKLSNAKFYHYHAQNLNLRKNDKLKVLIYTKKGKTQLLRRFLTMIKMENPLLFNPE